MFLEKLIILADFLQIGEENIKHLTKNLYYGKGDIYSVMTIKEALAFFLGIKAKHFIPVPNVPHVFQHKEKIYTLVPSKSKKYKMHKNYVIIKNRDLRKNVLEKTKNIWRNHDF